MSDTTRDTTERDTARQCATITEAARILRVSIRTVQRRLDSGALNSIERDGKRLVQLPTNATESATPDAPTRRDTRQNDATERDTAQAGSTPDLAAMLTQSREEILFLRGLVEQRDRDAAELRAALRKSLDAMPRALPSGSTPDAENATRENEPQSPQATHGDQTNAASKQSAPRGARVRQLTAWQRIGARLLGIRK